MEHFAHLASFLIWNDDSRSLAVLAREASAMVRHLDARLATMTDQIAEANPGVGVAIVTGPATR
jgi:hypothetical protein